MLSARFIVCTLIFLVCSAAGIAGLATGKVIAHTQSVARADSPVGFWVVVGVYGAVAAVALRQLIWG
jgi:hypothetical protein